MSLDDFLRETADEFAKAHAKQAAADAEDKCPHCGAGKLNDRKQRADWTCGSFRRPNDGTVWRSVQCETNGGKPTNCPHCGAKPYAPDGTQICPDWECDSFVNVGVIMQSPGCMRAELVTLRARVAALEAEIKGASQ